MAEAAQSAAGPGEAGKGEAVDGGNYEVIRRRLVTLGETLRGRADDLNARRKSTFGGTELSVLANGRVRTEHNCLPRDVVSVNGQLLVGYQLFLGLKQETKIEDVFGLYRFDQTPDGYDFTRTPQDEIEFLNHPDFVKDFGDLFRYYRDCELVQMQAGDTHLLAVFRIGATIDDAKVCRWRVDPGGRLTYLDNRGERDLARPPSHDFTWTLTGREQQVQGHHPHINILDTVFVETVGGDLTVKVEDNTEDGQGIYREPVEDRNQTLDDGEIHFARLGTLILLKIKPYREQAYRYLVFNTRTQTVTRIDAIGRACVQLPEDHGIIFPGGYYLESGDFKLFDQDTAALEFQRVIRSPNGEDVLYVFYRRAAGDYTLLPYNLIRKEVQSPILCNGYSLFEDGRMVVFRASTEPSRVHPMQVWQTPFTSAEFAASAPTDGSFLAKVGNADLVRGISDALSVGRLIDQASPSRQTYEDLIAALTRMRDSYYWLANAEVGFRSVLDDLLRTAELIIDEFEKVVAFRAQAKAALSEAEKKQIELLRALRAEEMRSVDAFMRSMTALRGQRGHLITLREVRYIDLARLDALEAETVETFDRVTRECVRFLLRDEALAPLKGDLDTVLGQAEAVEKVAEIEPLRKRLIELGGGLDLLTEVISGLQIDDATQRTAILEGISEVFGHLNRVRATVEGRRKELLGREGRAEFGAQFKLFGQSVSSALSLCDTPERCDEELSRLMIQLEELEARFSEFDEFLGDLAAKRDEVYEAFGSRKQTLLDERNRRVQNILAAVDRVFEGMVRRTRTFKDEDALNAYFASDGMVLKVRQFAEQLGQLGDAVKGDELLARLKSTRQDALRGLRDKLDLFAGGDNLIAFGRHQFTVNTQAVELTMVPRGEGMALHLTGTDFYEPIEEAEFLATAPFWAQSVISENAAVYRAEYLAATLLFAAERGEGGLSVQAMLDAQRTEGGLAALVRDAARERYEEGYERGLHDADAALILEKLLHMHTGAGLLRFGPVPRAIAALFWGAVGDAALRGIWHRKAQNLGRLRRSFRRHPAALNALADEISERIRAFGEARGLPEAAAAATLAGRYLVEELTAEKPRFTTSREAVDLQTALLRHLDDSATRRDFDDDLRALEGDLVGRVTLARAWIEALIGQSASTGEAGLALEAAVLIGGSSVDREVSSAVTRAEVKGLLGNHPRVVDRAMTLQLDAFLGRLTTFVEETVPGYRAYRQQRGALLDRARVRLRLDEFKPRVMSSFVRNKLINDVYLPIIGDNLAKQMGAAGAAKRTDLMGLLLLISPPGYGKTTLMEYVANRLGLVFVKVNGPSLGHSVVSLDPNEAPNATARQEVDKINLAFEMGNNVMLYLDDVQHTHPEFLQKFISLCDAQRKVEGVWRGRTRTYDLRGKKFCVVMAGNPYTETGAKFVIPDMLANRADTYNLGDILDGKDDVFALSYIENALTSNAVLAPLATRSADDIYKLIARARGAEVAGTDLKHGYSAVEINEITEVIRRLSQIQKVVLKVNMQYIASASIDDAFRVEPAFKLQGSYRNMNKMAEKVRAAMTEAEVEALIDDHYNGESQTLTTGAENNLLKLAELRGRMSEAQRARFEEVKRAFRRVQTMGGKDDDPVARVTGTLGGLGEHLGAIREALDRGVQGGTEQALAAVAQGIHGLREALADGGGRAFAAPLSQLAVRLDAIRDALGDGGAKSMQGPLAAVATQLDGIRDAVRQAAERRDEPAASRATPPPLPGLGRLGEARAPATDPALARVLSELSGALREVSRPQVEVKVQNLPPPGVEELLAQQVQLIERTLVPLVRASAENLQDAQAIGTHVRELIDLLKEVDAGLRRR
ncbi:MAG: DNA repair ATPase [Myxococcales bacterium]|nr:DNA repair ATPase [Myxococcales bacterium]